MRDLAGRPKRIAQFNLAGWRRFFHSGLFVLCGDRVGGRVYCTHTVCTCCNPDPGAAARQPLRRNGRGGVRQGIAPGRDIQRSARSGLRSVESLSECGFAAGGSASLGFLCAILSVFVAYLRVFGNSLGARDLFLGPMAKPQRMATLTIACLYSAVAPSDWFGALGSGASTGVASLALALIILGTIVTAVRRLGRVAAQVRGSA